MYNMIYYSGTSNTLGQIKVSCGLILGDKVNTQAVIWDINTEVSTHGGGYNRGIPLMSCFCGDVI